MADGAGPPPSAPDGDVPAGLRRLGHDTSLDGLRAVAVLLVLAGHIPVLVPSTLGLVPGGFLGVDIFFVLSGFLITTLLLREQADRSKIRFGAFYRRRALRLLPALVVLLAAFVIYVRVTGLDTDIPDETAFATLFYHVNWKLTWDLRVSNELGHMWSLAVEEQFYLVWPAVVALALGVRQRLWVTVTVLVVAIAGVALWRAHLYEDGTGVLALYVRTDTRADGVLVGALAANLWIRGVLPSRGLGIAAWAGVVVIGYLARTADVAEPFLYQGGYTLVALSAAAILLASVERQWFVHRVLRWRVLGIIGMVSYGLYLWHLPIFLVVDRYADDLSRSQRAVVGLSITAAAVALSWFLVERPALRWKDRLEGRSAARRAASSPVDPAVDALVPPPTSAGAG